MAKPKKPFEIPNSFLSQLNEYTEGGYVLFTMQNGTPVVHCQFDNEVTILGLTKFIQIWSDSTEDIVSSQIYENLTGEEPPENGEDFSDEE